MREERHDDHIWLSLGGVGWAIYSIHRHPGGRLFIQLWRGYEPNLQWHLVTIEPGHDWRPYCEAAARLLREEEGREVT